MTIADFPFQLVCFAACFCDIGLLLGIDQGLATSPHLGLFEALWLFVYCVLIFELPIKKLYHSSHLLNIKILIINKLNF